MRKLTALIALLLICTLLFGCSKTGGTVVVGAKDYTEQHILGHILALLIEDNTSLSVSLTMDLSSEVVFAGLTTGAIDLYVEYSGTVYATHLKNYVRRTGTDEAIDPDEIFGVSKKSLNDDHDIFLMERLGFNNTYIIAVRKETASQYNLRTISDLAQVSSDFVFGGSSEILTRSDGIPNLKRVYDMSFKEVKAKDGIARYTAIINDEVQVTEAYSTDGMLLEYELVVLEDNKNFFPPYEAAILIRNDTIAEHPELTTVLNKLTGLLTDDIMRSLNYKVDVLGADPKDVAEAFLRENNLIR